MKKRTTGDLWSLPITLLLAWSAVAAAQAGSGAEASGDADTADATSEAASPAEPETAAKSNTEAGTAGEAAAAQPEPVPAPVPVRTRAPTAAGSGAGGGSAACLIGYGSGVNPGDAETATLMVCRELSRRGANVGMDIDAGAPVASAYRVELRKLGHIYLLDVSYESPIGTVIDRESVQLASIEEVPVAAPRVAEAMIEKKPVDRTARVDSIFGDEARIYPKKYGELLFGLGLFGFALIGNDIVPGGGVQAQLYHETPSYSVGGHIRLGGASPAENRALVLGLAVGGRYFFNDTDVSPYVGGGLSYHLIEVWNDYQEEGDDEYYWDYQDELHGRLFGAYLAVGVELMRLYDSRLDFELRVDLPFNQLQGDSDNRDMEDQYMVPISLAAVYSWD